MTRLLAAAFAAIALTGHAGTSARPGDYRILLTSNRDGQSRGYSMRPDGSRLTPLLPRGRALVPTAVSRDGSTIAYQGHSGIYVSRADGSGLHRVVGTGFSTAALSTDGRVLAFAGTAPDSGSSAPTGTGPVA